MAYNVFPTLLGKGWDIIKRPIWSNIIQQAASGAEYRTAQMQYPLYEFELTVPYLSATDWANLVGFFNGQGGNFTPFYLTHDNDNAEVAQLFGTGTGSLATFSLMKSDGSTWVEPITGLNGAATIFAAGTQILAAGTGTPASPAHSTTAGGAKGSRTYFIRITYVDAAGNESNSSTEVSQAVGANNLLTVTSPGAATGAVSWNLYLNTVTNTEKYQQNAAIGVNYTEPTSALSFAGAAYPVVDNTPYTVSAGGSVVFVHAPANAVALTWTGSYYYLVRFKDPQIDLNQFMSNMFESKPLILRTPR